MAKTSKNPSSKDSDRVNDQPLRRRSRGAGSVSAGANAARVQLARAVRIISVVLAAILALGALLVVLKSNVNQDNVVVQLLTDVADAVSGPFSRNGGIFDFGGKDGDAKNALVNWGIAAIVWLVIGRLLATVIEPRSTR